MSAEIPRAQPAVTDRRYNAATMPLQLRSRSTDLRLVRFFAGLAAEEVEIAFLVRLQDVLEKHGVVAPPEAPRRGPPVSQPLLEFFVRDHEVQAALRHVQADE